MSSRVSIRRHLEGLEGQIDSRQPGSSGNLVISVVPIEAGIGTAEIDHGSNPVVLGGWRRISR